MRGSKDSGANPSGPVEERRRRNIRQLLLRALRIVNRHVVEGLHARGYSDLRSTHTTLLSNKAASRRRRSGPGLLSRRWTGWHPSLKMQATSACKATLKTLASASCSSAKPADGSCSTAWKSGRAGAPLCTFAREGSINQCAPGP
jgi:hypothetical protein